MVAPATEAAGGCSASNRLLLVKTNSRGKSPAPGLAGDCRPPPACSQWRTPQPAAYEPPPPPTGGRRGGRWEPHVTGRHTHHRHLV